MRQSREQNAEIREGKTLGKMVASRFFLLSLASCLLNALPAQSAEPVWKDKDVFRVRESIEVAADEVVANVVSLGGSIRVDGTVKENAVAIGGDVIVSTSGAVEGDAVAVGGRVVQAPGSHISGRVTSVPFSTDRLRKGLAFAIPALIAGLSAMVGAALVLGSLGSIALAVLVLVLFPQQTEKTRLVLEAHPWKALFLGFAGLLMSVPILIFLMITLIGIPLAFVAAVVLMAALILGTVATGQWIGMRIAQALKKTFPPWASGLIGLVILSLAASIPILGVFIQGLIVCLALGSVALSRFGLSQLPPPSPTTK